MYDCFNQGLDADELTYHKSGLCLGLGVGVKMKLNQAKRLTAKDLHCADSDSACLFLVRVHSPQLSHRRKPLIKVMWTLLALRFWRCARW